MVSATKSRSDFVLSHQASHGKLSAPSLESSFLRPTIRHTRKHAFNRSQGPNSIVLLVGATGMKGFELVYTQSKRVIPALTQGLAGSRAPLADGNE